MKAIAAALFLLAVLAMAEARPTMRVLNKKTQATATSVAVAEDGGYASSGASADAENGGNADAGSVAYAAGPDAVATSYADAHAEDWAQAKAKSKAVALGPSAYADSYAGADAAGEVTADAKSKAVAVGPADATSTAYAYGDATAKSVAYAKATPEPKDPEPKKYYYPYYHYYPKDTEDNEDDGYAYNPYYYYHHGYYGYKAVDPTMKYPHHGHYVIVKPVEEEEEVTPVKFVDPAILAFYAQHVYDFGCFEGKYYRCTYDDSCGECPYGYFCGEKTKEVCEDVEVWVKKCDPAAPAKKCVPDLTACGTGFCKFNEKCAADYYWCHAKWCTPKYTCVAVEAPKKCVWELVDGRKVQKCAEYAPAACGDEMCPAGYKCSEDPCTFEKKIVKKCEDKAVPVCIAYDIPIYKTLFSKCGPGYCHPGYKCESFDHDSCAPKVVVQPVYVGYKPHDPVVVDPYEDDEEDKHVYLPYQPHYPHEDDEDDESSASVTAKAVAVSTPDKTFSYTKVDADATGDGKAKGVADASATNDDSSANSWTGVYASAPASAAVVKVNAEGDNAYADGTGTADYAASDK